MPDLAETQAHAAVAAANPGGTAALAAAAGPDPLAPLRARDPEVNQAELLARARECFYAVESAVAQRQVDAAQACVTPALLATVRTSLDSLAAAHRHRVLAFIDVEGARLVEAAADEQGERAVVRLDVSGEDCVVDDATGAVVEGSSAQRRWSEDWSLRRSGPGDAWVVEAVSGPAA